MEKCFKTRCYICDDPRFNSCTLFERDNIGLAIIQQRYNANLKCTWWGPIDKALEKEILLKPEFKEFFEANARAPINGLYSVFELRKVMWAIGMRPLPKAIWETKFY